jgi:hypothetical protein
LTVQDKERREVGLWGHCHNPIVFDFHRGKEQPGQPVPFLVGSRLQGSGEVVQQGRRALQVEL